MSVGPPAAEDTTTERVAGQLAAITAACLARQAEAFPRVASAFVDEWQSQRSHMELHAAFVDAAKPSNADPEDSDVPGESVGAGEAAFPTLVVSTSSKSSSSKLSKARTSPEAMASLVK